MCFDCDEIDEGKRTFLKGATAAIVGIALENQAFGRPEEIPRSLTDPNVIHHPVTFKRGAVAIKGYLARPKKEGRYRGIIVAHGNPGISEDIKNAAAQMAGLGYVGLAIDWNSRAMDSTKLDTPTEFIYTNAFDLQNLADTQAGIDYLKTQSFVKGERVGILGFCGGGHTAARLATTSKDVMAAVVFYGPPRWRSTMVSATDPKPNLMDFVTKIEVPVQFHYGTKDWLIPLDDVTELGKKVVAHKRKSEFYTYENSGHAFYDYTRPQAHNAIAAYLAYQRMSAFFKRFVH